LVQSIFGLQLSGACLRFMAQSGEANRFYGSSSHSIENIRIRIFPNSFYTKIQRQSICSAVRLLYYMEKQMDLDVAKL